MSSKYKIKALHKEIHMGVKISSVKDKATAQEITVKDCEGGYTGEYVCKTDGCSANMSFVKYHEQRRHNKTIVIPSFFKLKPNEKHAYRICPFNTRGAVEIIARESDSNILRSIDNNKYEFNLQVLHRENKRQSLNATNKHNSEINNSRDRKSKTYTRKGTASSYIKTLTQILTLRARLEENNELASLVTLTYQQSKVKWSDFYFEIDNYVNAYEKAKSLKAKYPMCFHGIVSKSIAPSKNFKYHKFKLHSPYVELKNKVNLIPSIEFIISDESLDIESISPGAEILVYGMANTSTGDWIPPDEKGLEYSKALRFLNMQIWINHAEQIAKL
jgi:hypothetical protein